MPGILVRRVDWREWSTFAATWEHIQNMSPNASFFLSREWVDCWLATFGDQLNPDLLTFVADGSVIGCCLLVWRTQWVRGIPLRRVFLNCAGEDETDSTFIEYNSLLSYPGCEKDVASALAKFLKDRQWDELLLPGMVEQERLGIVAGSLGHSEVSKKPARRIEFCQLRKDRSSYLASLSAKTRYHIRRTQRAFEETGSACTVRFAQDVQEALEMLRELALLHQARWEGLGQTGCFRSARFTNFHERLIRQRFDRALLFRVQAGEVLIGLLYCYLYDGWVYHYQSGFSYTLDKRRSPGLLTLSLVIEQCLQREELKGFDFMAGESEYKRSLTGDTDHRLLHWYTIRRRTAPSLLLRVLRAVKRNYEQATRKDRESFQPHGGG